MSQASEQDLFARALAGDYQSRVDLYKKFVHENPRVRRMGAHYPVLDDFLHDCFTNLLRAAHVFSEPGRMNEQVETVAAWTALERDRLKESGASGAPPSIRMCSAVEGDEAGNRARPDTYVPPRSGPEDSLPSCISAVVGEPQSSLLRSVARENATWDSAAAQAGKPVNTLGPMAVRAIDRLSRYFGAPPVLNADLEPVFSAASAADAATRGVDRFKPRGRMIAMQLDSAFYLVTPEMRRLGVTVPSEARTIALWDAARASTPPAEALRNHLDKCHYCAEVLRSMLRLQQALLSGDGVDFRVCPGASTLLQDPDLDGKNLKRHLKDCAVCRDERLRAQGDDSRGSPLAPELSDAKKPVKKIAWAAAAGLLLGAVIIGGGYRYFAAGKSVVPDAAPVQVAPELPPIPVNAKYAALVERVNLDDPKMLASVLPRNQLIFMEARDSLKSGNSPKATYMAERLVNGDHDPGAQMLYAECLYARSPGDGYRAMLKAEAMPPQSPFRCWTALQAALMIGDTATAEREVAHLANDPEYGPRAKKILARMQTIK
jgi:hypothetical protein